MNTQTEDATTIGLTLQAHEKLKALKENGYFAEMQDAFRFAVGLALRDGVLPTKATGPRTTIFNIGTLDPEGELRALVLLLITDSKESPYRTIENLAEHGINMLVDLTSHGVLRVSDLITDDSAI